MTIITDADLVGVPGVSGTTQELTYAARRASTAVEDAWCNPIDPVPDWVKDIAIDVAADYLINPTGASSVTRSVDDASRTVRYDGGRKVVRSGPFRLTDDELSRLCPTPRRGVSSVRLNVPGYGKCSR